MLPLASVTCSETGSSSCDSQSSTGTALDAATCVVVQLDLQDNNLTGSLTELESLESDDMEDEASTDRVATSSTESTEEIHKPSLPGLHATAAR